MSDPVGTFSGLSSGIQWRDMVTQIVALESNRIVAPLTARQTALDSASAAWSEFQVVASKFRDAAKAVRDATAFGAFTASATPSPTSSRHLVSVTADSTAAPSSYSIEVEQLAVAEKLGGAIVGSASTALQVVGSFIVNGNTVNVIATDTLGTVRDKINALNSGASPSGVSAAILRSGNGSRLVLSANQTGEAGIDLVDDAASNGTLKQLGFTDGESTIANITSAGYTQTARVTSSVKSFANMLGIPLPTPSSIKVGGHTISVDLRYDSLSVIAARINAVTQVENAASVVTESVGGTTFSRLRTSLAVAVDTESPADPAISARTLAVLGFTKEGRSGIRQVVASSNLFKDAGNSNSNATTNTLLADLQVGGNNLGLLSTDVITIAGRRGDGSVVSRTMSVGASTVGDLLLNANDSVSGFGLPSRSASLSIDEGRLVLTDSAAGDSQLGITITVERSGSTFSLGSFATDGSGTVGRNRQLATGADAHFRIDDQFIARSTNTVSDIVTGVTFNLLAAEKDSYVEVNIARNLDEAVSRLQSFAQAYNDIRTWADSNTAAGKRLAGSSALKSMVNSLSSSLLTPVGGLSGAYTTAAMAGLSRDKNGTLSVNSATLKSALSSNFEDVRKLFGWSGLPSNSAVQFLGASDSTEAGTYNLVVTSNATTASVTGSVDFSGYTSGNSDIMSVKDEGTGNSADVTLTTGDTLDQVIAKLNSAFATKKMNLLASATSNKLTISSSDYGTTGGITISYGQGPTGDGATQLGISAGSTFGVNIAGTINGVAATGSGRTLTGATGTDGEGLRFNFTGTGTPPYSAGAIAFSLGVGGLLYNTATSIARDLDGQAAVLASASSDQADALSSRILDAQERLARRRASLIAQFTAMESAMNRSQAVSASLSSSINGLFSYNKTS